MDDLLTHLLPDYANPRSEGTSSQPVEGAQQRREGEMTEYCALDEGKTT